MSRSFAPRTWLHQYFLLAFLTCQKKDPAIDLLLSRKTPKRMSLALHLMSLSGSDRREIFLQGSNFVHVDFVGGIVRLEEFRVLIVNFRARFHMGFE